MALPGVMNFPYVSGSVWRREKPRPSKPLTTPVSKVVVSYTLKQQCFEKQYCIEELKWIQKCHMYKAKIGDLRFNFLVGGDGSVYEGRGWFVQPVLPKQPFSKLSSECLFIAFMGLFKDGPPTPEMLKIQDELIKYGVQNNYITKQFTLFTLRNTKDSRLHFKMMQSPH